MSDPAILLLAAGASSRMRGRDKLLEPVDGQPLLARMCQRAVDSALPTYVTLPDRNHPRAAHIGSATPVIVPDAGLGMSASIRRGVAALPDHVSGVMILPADMPDITNQDIRLLARHFQSHEGGILRATAADGTPGHPVLFPRRLFDALQQISGDQGARVLLKGENVQPVALPARHALTDLDTPEAWADWRSRT